MCINTQREPLAKYPYFRIAYYLLIKSVNDSSVSQEQLNVHFSHRGSNDPPSKIYNSLLSIDQVSVLGSEHRHG